MERAIRLGLTLVPIGVVLAIGGCDKSARLVGKRVRNVTVGTVVDQGLTLDRDASPEQVVYVLLKAIKDDVEAGDDGPAREAAFDRQLAVCAPDTIFGRSIRKRLGRDECVHRIVWHWAPTLAYYIGDFPPDWPTARERLLAGPVLRDEDRQDGGWVHTYIELADPSGDHNASVVAQFQLVREGGYWRVAQEGFVRNSRHLMLKGKTATTGGTGSSTNPGKG